MSDDVFVKGHYRKGKWIEGHFKTRPEKGNPQKNYSFPGNFNPYKKEFAPGTPSAYLYNNYEKERLSSTSFSIKLPEISKTSQTFQPLLNPNRTRMNESRYAEGQQCHSCGIKIGKDFVKKLLGKTYCGLCIGEARSIRRQQLLGNNIQAKDKPLEVVCHKCNTRMNKRENCTYLGNIYCQSCVEAAEIEIARLKEEEIKKIKVEKVSRRNTEKKRKNKEARVLKKNIKVELHFFCELCRMEINNLEVKKLLGKPYCQKCIGEVRSKRMQQLSKRKRIRK